MEDKNNTLKLPKFLIKGVKVNCYLGDNDALPNGDDYPFIYKILKNRYEEINEVLSKEYNTLDINDLDSLKKRLSTLYREVKDIENPIKNELEKICTDTVIELFSIPNEAIEFNCELVDTVQVNVNINIEPISNDILQYEYEDTDDMTRLQKEVLKRRVIDALIQGGSYLLSECYHLFVSKIYALNKKLPTLYDEIKAINDYMLFTENTKITDKHTYQGGFVEVMIGRKGTATKINAKGIIFPFLLTETIRGVLELFASHALPFNTKKANLILKQADFLAAEPWDLRCGVGLWKLLINNDEITDKLTPYFFSRICKLDVDDFNNTLKNIFAKTKAGKMMFNVLKKYAELEKQRCEFMGNIQKKKMDKAVMTDGYYSNEELDELLLDSEL